VDHDPRCRCPIKLKGSGSFNSPFYISRNSVKWFFWRDRGQCITLKGSGSFNSPFDIFDYIEPLYNRNNNRGQTTVFPPSPLALKTPRVQ